MTAALLPLRAPAAPNRPDLVLAVAILCLTALGVVMVHSAGAILSERRHGDAFHFLERQAIHAALGVGAMLLALLVHPRFWQKLGGVLLVGAFGLLVAVLVVPDLGPPAKGASRWIQLGPVGFQASELAKVALLLYFSRFLARNQALLPRLGGGYLPALAVIALLVAPILLQPDLGTAVTLAAVALAILFAAGARLRHLGVTVLAALPVLYWLVDSAPYRRARMLAFLDPLAHRQVEGYQIYESMISFASGNWTGVGLGEGPQKLGFFPEYHNDFVLAAVGEELGLVGVAVAIVLFAIVVWRGLRIARRVADRSLSLLAFGISALLGIQAVVHMGVATAVLPTKGLSLPFVSYGGSSLAASLFLAGVLLQIGREPQQPAPAEAP